MWPFVFLFLLSIGACQGQPGDPADPNRPSHTCSVVLRGATSDFTESFSLAALQIECWSGDDRVGNANGASDGTNAATVTVRLGHSLLDLVTKRGVIPTVSGVNDDWRTAPRNRTIINKGSDCDYPSPSNDEVPGCDQSECDDWGIDILDVPHLQLLDSKVANVPLSAVSSLLQCLNCSRLTVRNLTLRNLQRQPSQAAPPFGAARVTGVQRSSLERIHCSDVIGAMGWACILLHTLPNATTDIRSSTFINNIVDDSSPPPSPPCPPSPPSTLAPPSPPSPPSQPDNSANGLPLSMLRCTDDIDDQEPEYDQYPEPIHNAALPGYGAVLVASYLKGDDCTTAGDSFVRLEGTTMNNNTGGCGAGMSVSTATPRGLQGVICGDGRRVRLSVTNSKFSYNKAAMRGGGLHVWDPNGATVDMNISGASLMSYNAAPKKGGAAYAYGSSVGDLNVADSQLLSNTAADGPGGAISVTASRMSSLLVNNSTLSNNNAGSEGGAIYVHANYYSVNRIRITGASILHNNSASSNGGAVCVRTANGDVTSILLDGSSAVSANKAGGNGGGVYVENANGGIHELNLTGGSSLTGNVAANGNGGAAYLAADSSGYIGPIYIVDAEVFNNSAMCHSSLQDGCGNGGGMYMSAKPGTGRYRMFEVTVERAELTYNTARRHGGAMYIVCEGQQQACASPGFSLHGATFTRNRAQNGSGGAVYLRQPKANLDQMLVSNTSFIDNEAACRGGAISVNTKGLVDGIVDSVTITNGTNTTGRIGSVTITNGSVFASNEARRTSRGQTCAEDSSLSGSSPASTPCLSHGGAIYFDVNQLGLVTIAAGSSMVNNSAEGDGGAIAVSELTPAAGLLITGGSNVSHNKATCRGGFLLLMTGTWSNRTVVFRVEAKDHRGLSPRPCNYSIAANNSASYGGFLYAGAPLRQDVYIQVAGSNITGNSADNSGGAFHLNDAESLNLTIEGSTVAWNSATQGEGGAFFLQARAANSIIDASNISWNRANIHGGAFSIITTGEQGIEHFMIGGGSAIDNNVANKGSGGGIYIKADSGNIKNISVTDRSRLANNEAGGDGGAMAAVAADHVRALNWNGMSTLSNNTADGKGGGLSVSANSVQVAVEGGCIWDKNTARSDGGALLISANSLPDNISAASSVVIAGGSKLRRNSASNGGAVYIDGFANFTVSEGSSMSSNSAEYDGGAAVFTQLPPSFHLESCDILGNSAARGSGGAFYLSTVVPWTPKTDADGCPFCAFPSSIVRLDITNVSVANNTARAANGGAFYVKPHETCCAGTSITFGVVASRFNGNKAMGAGGAIAMYDASNATATVSINGSRFSGNTAGIVSGDFKNIVNFGGAITIWREPADSAGDLTTLCQLSAADTSFEANECNGGSGGAVTLIACSAKFIRCNFTANRATLSGGAIAALHVPRTTATLGLTTSGFLDSSPAGGDFAGQSQNGLGRRRVLSRIAAPTARQPQTWAAWESVSDSRPDGSRLAPSAARRKLWDSFPWDDFGSGCAASRHWSISLLDCNFLSNYAALEFGGALYLYASSDGGHVQIDRNNFTENKALSQHAGAVFLAARGAGTSVQLTNSVFDGNAASASSAGALYVLLGMLACGELANVSLSRNSAATSGGACVLDIRSNGALVVDNVTAVKNSALAGDGGALKLQVQTGSAALLRGCGFNDNKAAGNGGAALLDGNCRSYLSLQNTRMARNWAGLSGGGLYASYAARTAPTTDGSAFGSSPAAVYSAAAPCPPDDAPDASGEWQHMSVQLADFRDNEAGQQGGAIFVAPASTVTLTNATMDKNTACAGGGSLAAQSCSALALRHSTLHNSATTGSGGGFYASGCRRILFEFVDVAGNEAACSGGGLLVTGGEVTSIGGSSSTASVFATYTSALLHRVRVTGNAAGSKSGRADGSCGADKAPRQQTWRAGAGGGLFINGSVVAVLSRSNLTEQNDALFGHQIATAQRCYPTNAAASPSAGNKIFDPPEVKEWDRVWTELDGLARRQCWVLQLSDSVVPPVVDTRATQDLPIWVEDFLASALHARCSSEYQFQAQFDNEAIDVTIRNVVRDRLVDTQGRVFNSTNFLVGQTLSYVSNGAISASADVMEPLKDQRVRDIANQLDDCVLRPASFKLTDVNDLLRNSSYIGLPATYIGLMAFENPDVAGRPVHLQLQTGVSFNLTAQLYDTLQHRFTSDIGPSTVTLALRPRPLDDGPSAAAADGSVPWLYEDIANLDPGLNRSLTVPVINGLATWSGVKAYAWPGNYSLVLSTYVESFIKVAPLEVKVEILPCAVGQTLDRSHNGYKESWTGCTSCASGQYGLWADNRLPLTKITMAGADHGDGALAGNDSGGDGSGSGGSAARSLQRFLTKMNDTLKASDDSCKTCPSNALCLGGAVIVPEQGYWHSAANSTQIHSCPNPSACSSPKDDGPREFPRWLDERMGTQWDRRTKLLAWCQLTWYSSVVPGADITAAYYSAYPPVSNASAVAEDDNNATALAVLLNRDASLWGKQTASEAEFNCLLFGLAPGHPDSYMQQLCLEGYTGNLCASCVAGYYVDSDLNCKRCPELARTITLGLISFFSSVILVLITTMTNLTEGFGEKKARQQQQQQEVQVQQAQTREPRDPVELGDVVKVIVLHFQYLIIVTRLSVDYPSIIVRCQAVFSTITGAENYIVYSPSCLKPESDSGGQALIQWLAGILTPCAVAVVSMLLWTLRYGYPLRKVAGEALGNGLLSAWAAMRGARRAAATWREGRHLQNSRSDVQSVCGSEGSAVVLSSSKHLVAYDPTSMPSPFTISGGGPVLKDTSSLPFPEAQEGGIGLCTVFSRDIHVVAFDGADAIGTPAEAAAPIAGATAMVSLATPASPTDPTDAAPQQAPALPTAASAALVVDLDGVVGGCPAKAPEPPSPDGSAAGGSDQAAAALHASHAHALDVSVIPEDPLSDMPDILRAGGDGAAFRGPASAAAAPPPLLGSAGSGTHIPADGIRLRSAPTTVLSSAAAYGGGGGQGGCGGGPAQQVAYYRHPYSEAWHRKTPRTLSAHMRSAAINEAAFKTLHKLRTLAVSTQQSSQATFHQVDKAMSLREQLGVVLMAAVFILYPSWANAALSTFACYPIDDGKGPFPQGQQATWRHGYWVRDMQTQCYSGTHLHVYVPIGVAAVLVFCLLPPLASFMFVWRVRNRLEDTHVRKVYGFLYKRYKPRYIWWETALQLETLVLVTVEVLGRGLSVSYQALLLLAVFIFIALFNVSCAPLVSQLLVIMEYMSLGTLSLTITLSLYFTVDDGLNPAAQNMLAILIITLNVCLLVYFLYVASRHFWPSAVKKVAPKAQAVLRKLSSIGSSAGNNHSHNPQQHLRKPPHAADSDSSEGGGSRFCWPLLGRFAVWRGNDAATGSSEVDGGRAASTSSETLDAAGRHVLERFSDEFSDTLSGPADSDLVQLAFAGSKGLDIARASVCLDDRLSSYSMEMASRVADYPKPNTSHVCIQLEEGNGSGGNGAGGGFYPRI